MIKADDGLVLVWPISETKRGPEVGREEGVECHLHAGPTPRATPTEKRGTPGHRTRKSKDYIIITPSGKERKKEHSWHTDVCGIQGGAPKEARPSPPPSTGPCRGHRASCEAREQYWWAVHGKCRDARLRPLG